MADAMGIAPAQTSITLKSTLNAPREFADSSTKTQVPVVSHLLTDEAVGLVEVNYILSVFLQFEFLYFSYVYNRVRCSII